jgi:nucleoside-diphosphate-sugar epimerase
VRVFVAGATGALGVPVVRLLVEGGHQVVGFTRSEAKRPLLEGLGATAVVGDVLDADGVERAVVESAPAAIVSLLTALPKRGPTMVKHLRPNARVHRDGTANIVRAARAARVERIVAESVIFRYGYGDLPRNLTEDAPPPETVPPRFPAEVLDALRSLEASVTGAGGIALRYGVFYGPSAGHVEFLTSMLRRGLMRVPGGDRGALSWIHVDDAATATVLALEHGRGGEIYNVCDDEPASFDAFVRALAAAIQAKPPKALPLSVAKVAMPYATLSMTSTITMSNAKAKAELGWTPRYPSIRDGLATITPSRSA